MSDEKPKRGFAAMDPALQRVIAAKGGRKAHQLGKAHRFTSAEAQAAGRIGGKKAQASKRCHKFTSEIAAASRAYREKQKNEQEQTAGAGVVGEGDSGGQPPGSSGVPADGGQGGGEQPQ